MISVADLNATATITGGDTVSSDTGAAQDGSTVRGTNIPCVFRRESTGGTYAIGRIDPSESGVVLFITADLAGASVLVEDRLAITEANGSGTSSWVAESDGRELDGRQTVEVRIRRRPNE